MHIYNNSSLGDPISRPQQVINSQNLENRAEPKLGPFEVRLALGPSEEPEGDSGLFPDRTHDANEQIGIEKNWSELVGDVDPVGGGEYEVSVMGVGEGWGDDGRRRGGGVGRGGGRVIGG